MEPNTVAEAGFVLVALGLVILMIITFVKYSSGMLLVAGLAGLIGMLAILWAQAEQAFHGGGND